MEVIVEILGMNRSQCGKRKLFRAVPRGICACISGRKGDRKGESSYNKRGRAEKLKFRFLAAFKI